jgi:hypothetical protein
VLCAPSRWGNFWDNGDGEHLLALETERIARETNHTRNETSEDVFEHIE